MAENERNDYGMDKLSVRAVTELESAIKNFTATCSDSEVAWHVSCLVRDVNFDLYPDAATFICNNYEPAAYSWFGGVILDSETDKTISGGCPKERNWEGDKKPISGFLRSIDKDEPDAVLEDVLLKRLGSYDEQRVIDLFEPGNNLMSFDVGYFTTASREAIKKCGRLTLFTAAFYFARKFVREREKNAELKKRIKMLENQLDNQ